MSHIELRGVRVHNLKSIDLRLPIGQLIAITGVSGAGKSSLAFDTLVAEGRRRYIETFAPSARQFLERIERPDADALENLPPAIAFRAEAAPSSRATLGTLTETDDLLRLLFARLGRAFCPQCEMPLVARTVEDVGCDLQALPDGTKCVVAFPSSSSDEALAHWRKLGFARVIELPDSHEAQTGIGSRGAKQPAGRSGNDSRPMFEPQRLIVVDRLVVGRGDASRWQESIEQAYSHGGDRCVVLCEAEAGEARLEWDGRRWQMRNYSRRLICGTCGNEFPPLEPDLFYFESPLGACPQCSGSGLSSRTTAAVQASSRSASVTESTRQVCSECGGSRLNGFSRRVRLLDRRSDHRAPRNAEPAGMVGPTIAELRELRLAQLAPTLEALCSTLEPNERALVAHVLDDLSARLCRLLELGLGHLSLSRSPRAMSRGERRRALLAGVLATRLDNALYVLDEPSGGLHPLDAQRVLKAIQRLQQAGNTVIVVEHAAAFLDAADEVIELGPGAGREGGRIVWQGPPRSCPLPVGEGGRRPGEGTETTDVPSQSASVAKRVLHPRPFPEGTGTLPRPTGDWLSLDGVTLHNLRGVSVQFPLQRLCVVTGVSGSGKSSLIEHSLYPALCRRFGIACDVDPVGEVAAVSGAESLEDVVFLDSSPIRRSARANAATLLHLLAEIRGLFAQTTEAKVKNFSARYFSFNASDGGRCPRCRGLGAIEIDMQFLANLTVTCPECHGTQFQREVLECKLRGLSLAEVLHLSADEAFTFFRGQPRLQRRLKFLKDVGLGYLPLGQSANTLSRGECQRLKLATTLARRSRRRTLFLMDEPCAGLHARDIAVLLDCFCHLIEVGHSLIAIEHRPEFIAAADWVVEVGPGAGDAGGRIVAQGWAN